MTMTHFAPKQCRNGMLSPFTSKFQTSTIGYYTYSVLDNMLLLTEYGIRVITAKTMYWQKIQ